MIAKEKGALVASVQEQEGREQEGRQARGRLQWVDGETEVLTKKPWSSTFSLCAKRARARGGRVRHLHYSGFVPDIARLCLRLEVAVALASSSSLRLLRFDEMLPEEESTKHLILTI